jgi:hypothetical protein
MTRLSTTDRMVRIEAQQPFAPALIVVTHEAQAVAVAMSAPVAPITPPPDAA